MCGHVGVINRNGTNLQAYDKFFKDGLVADIVRGKHGTGMLAVSQSGKVQVYKNSVNGSDFIEEKEVRDIMIGANRILCGHNRWATQGAINAINSHPFIHGDIIMFHNGTLHSHRSLNFEYQPAVDSDALAFHINKNIDRIPRALEEVDGAYSLVWYNQKDRSISFARNEERPMWMANVKNSPNLLYASERGMLIWLAERNKIEIEEPNELPSGKILTIYMDINKKFKVEPFTPKKFVTKTTYGTYYTIGGGNNQNSGTNTTPAKSNVVDINKNVPSTNTNRGPFLKGKYAFFNHIKTISLTCQEYHAYNSEKGTGKSDYGFLVFKYDTDFEILVSGVHKDEAADYLGYKCTLGIKAIISETRATATVLSVEWDIDDDEEVDDISTLQLELITNSITSYATQSSALDDNIIDDEDDVIDLLAVANEESKIRGIEYCHNCNMAIEGEGHDVKHGGRFCNSCADLHPQYIVN